MRIAQFMSLFPVAIVIATCAVAQSSAAQNILDIPGGRAGPNTTSTRLKAADVDRKANAAMPNVSDSESAPFPTGNGNATPDRSSPQGASAKGESPVMVI
jgi:hypothetical protein